MDVRLPRLTPRLSLVASFVRRGVVIADIGTDHAYLPVWLVNSNFCRSAVASDVKKGPLDSARRTASEYNAEEKISFKLADGMDGVLPSQADDIVIAGMGGELIADIIRRCDWLKDPTKHLVLQPMTAQAELREFLCESGFTITREAVAIEKSGLKLYLVMSVVFSGKPFTTDSVFYISGLLAQEGGAAERAYLEHQANILLKKAKGLRASKSENITEAVKAEELAGKIQDIYTQMQPL